MPHVYCVITKTILNNFLLILILKMKISKISTLKICYGARFTHIIYTAQTEIESFSGLSVREYLSIIISEGLSQICLRCGLPPFDLLNLLSLRKALQRNFKSDNNNYVYFRTVDKNFDQPSSLLQKKQKKNYKEK